MNNRNPKEVKELVKADLKQRHLTQLKLAEMMGMARQTIAIIMSSNDYFTEKHAALFSMALGYDRRFLMTGDGSLLSDDSEQKKKQQLQYYEKLLCLYRKSNEIHMYLNVLVRKRSYDEYREVLKKTMTLNSLLDTMGALPTNTTSGAIVIDDAMRIDSLEVAFNSLYDEIKLILSKDFDIDVEY